jgi:hypothetical protein
MLLQVATVKGQAVTFATVTPAESLMVTEAENPPQAETVAEMVGAVANNALNVGLLMVLGVAVVALVTIGIYALKQLQQSIPLELHGLIYETGKAGLNGADNILMELARRAEQTETKADDSAIERLREEVALLRKELEAFNKPKETL